MTNSVSFPNIPLGKVILMAASCALLACVSLTAAAISPRNLLPAHRLDNPTVTPLGTWLEQKVQADDGAADDSFSYSVDVSGDLAVVGAPDAAIAGVAGQGAVYVFMNSGGTWSQIQKLSADDGADGDEFGFSVSISGNMLLVGAPYATIGANGLQGAAYVFDASGGSFAQVQKLSADDGESNNNFGWSVSVSGSNALISTPSAAVGANALQGKVYVFTDTGGTWNQVQTLTADDGTAFASFGYSVALDGTDAIVGAQGEGGYFGAAYVFDRAGASWMQAAKLVPDDGVPGEFFGISVGISGANAIVGAYYQKVGSFNHQGSAYVFSNAGGSWSQAQKLTASDGAANDRFGLSVALDGSTALVGSYLTDIGGNANQGAAYVFSESAGVWSETTKLTASDGAADDELGNAVAVSGETALIGAFDADIDSQVDQGAAYFYTQPVDDTIFENGFEGTP